MQRFCKLLKAASLKSSSVPSCWHGSAFLPMLLRGGPWSFSSFNLFQARYASLLGKPHLNVFLLVCHEILNTWSTSDSITRVNDSTRLDSSDDFWWLELDSSHVEQNGDSTWLESRFSQNDSNRIESQWMTRDSSQSHLSKSLSSWWTNPVRLHTKKWWFFASVMIGGNFLFWLSSCAMLHFEDQVFPTCVEADLRLCFHWGVSRGTIYWHLIVV